MVPLLIGDQGYLKTQFCNHILPESMREYYMKDIKMDNAEQVERVLGRMWLVNIDEYDAKTSREQAKIKRLLTEKDVQIRRMRSDQYTMTPRLCSFIATTNDLTPLPSGDGTRRYLCVEVTGRQDPLPSDVRPGRHGTAPSRLRLLVHQCRRAGDTTAQRPVPAGVGPGDGALPTVRARRRP